MAELDDHVVTGLNLVDDGLEAALVRVGASGTATVSQVHDVGVLDRVSQVLAPACEAGRQYTCTWRDSN